jgi:hypothetical protein
MGGRFTLPESFIPAIDALIARNSYKLVIHP